jgi:hypothetical protein
MKRIFGLLFTYILYSFGRLWPAEMGLIATAFWVNLPSQAAIN